MSYFNRMNEAATASRLESEALIAKTQELCEAIVNSPEFKAARQQVDTFMADDRSRQQYQSLAEKGEHLHHKQHEGVRLSPQEIQEFEQERSALMENPVARDFLAAQEGFHHLQDTITKYVTKTIELGRVAEESDFESCGHGCSCHH